MVMLWISEIVQHSGSKKQVEKKIWENQKERIEVAYVQVD